LEEPRDGVAPSVISKLSSVVNVCAGTAIAVVAHSTKIAYALFPKFSLPNALMIRFIDAPLFYRNSLPGVPTPEREP
jgi:hypothetical protein